MKIALIGYGKMGKTIEQIAISRGHEIVAHIDVDNQDDFDSKEFKSADIAIEFTAPSVAVENYRKAFNAGVSVVSGTTGWTERMEEVKSWCKEKNLAFFWTSNFSLGVNVFFVMNKYLAKIMNNFPEYEVGISETHHIHKLDAPSGTAITLADGIIENIDRKSAWQLDKPSEEDIIGIKSIREGEVPGIHTITYESDVDSISITHDAKNRIGLALGAVVAAEFTYGKKGCLSMSDMLKF